MSDTQDTSGIPADTENRSYFIDRARAWGYTSQEINDFLAPRMTKMRDAGYSQDQINAFYGITPPKPFDGASLQAKTAANLAASPKPVTSFEDALDAGWQISTAGLAMRGKVPDKQIAADAPWYSRIASGVATMVGDIPAMAGGFVIGAGGGAETGPGAVVTGTAGAFALPTVLRETMMDAYQKGQFQNFSDFWSRAAPIFINTAKSYITGAATGGAGVAAEAAAPAIKTALPAVISPTVAKATQTAVQIATMTTVGKALDGQVPSAQDFEDAAIILGGLALVTRGAGKLRNIYARTGVPPKAVLADAAQDVTIQQDLASTNREMPETYIKAASAAEQPATGMSASVRQSEAPSDTAIVSPERYGTLEERTPATQQALGGQPPAEPPQGGAPAQPTPERPAPGPATPQEAQETILNHLSVGETPAPRQWTLSRFYTDVFDRLFPISKATTEAARATGRTLETAENPYRLGRLYAGMPAKAQQMLDRSTFDFATHADNGPGLRQVLQPVAEDLDGFRAYIAARRAVELEGRGIETGFDMNAAHTVVENGEKYRATGDALIAYQDRVAQYLRDSGVLSHDGYDAMREANRMYVPFQRLMDEEPVTAIRGGSRSLTPRNPIHAIVGSERAVIDPLESVIRNTYAFIQMADRNVVGQKLVDLLTEANEATGRVTPKEEALPQAIQDMRDAGIPGADALADLLRTVSAPVRPDEIRIFRNGSPETFEVDPDVAAAFKGLDQESANTLLRMVGAPARLLRAGATLTPDFMARNLMRDFMTAAVNSGKAVFTPLDSMRGLASVISEDEMYQRWLKGGGAYAAMVSLDRDYLQTNIKSLTESTGLGTRAWNVVRHPIDTLRILSEVSEQATRVAEFSGVYRDAIARGLDEKAAAQEAAYSSREVTLDFARMGAKMQAMNMITAFFNAQLQGSDRIVRAFIDRPLTTSLKTAGYIVAPSLLLWWANHNDPRYQALPNWEKDLFWVVPTDNWQDTTPDKTAGLPSYLVRRLPNGQVQVNNGAIFRIPKPFELGVAFGSGPERILDAFVAHNPDAFKGYSGSVTSALMPTFIPTAALPMVEQFANRSTFTDRTLIPTPQEQFLPEYQYTPYTNETAKALGHLLGAFPGMRSESLEDSMGGSVARALTSPILLENYLRAWTGNMGMYALQVADAGLRKAGIVPDPPLPLSTLADIPFVRAFVVRYPSASLQPIQDFYDAYGKNKQFFTTLRAMAMQGDLGAVRQIQAAGGPGIYVQLDGIHAALGENSKLIRDIYKNPEITAAEKRQLIDTAYWRMTELAAVGSRLLAGAALQGASQ